MLFGLAPAIWRSRRQPAEVLKEGGRGSERRLHRWGNVLVVAEISLALLLTVGAGLLVRTFRELQRVDPGFDPHGVVAAGVNLPTARYDTVTKIVSAFQDLESRVRALPGVTGAALIRVPALSGGGWTSDYHVAGRPADEYGPDVMHRRASPDYFSVMREPLLAGRFFTPQDRLGAPDVLIINQALADEAFGKTSPLGQRMAFDRTPDSASTWYTIVGVVGNERQTSLALKPRTEVFSAFAQDANSYMTVVARSAGDPAALEPALRRALREVDPNLAFATMTTMTEAMARSVAMQRFIMILLFTFAGVGLTLALVGVYGVIAQLSRRRGREMGIRLRWERGAARSNGWWSGRACSWWCWGWRRASWAH